MAQRDRPIDESPSTDLTQLGAAEIARRVSAGETSALEVAEAHIGRIEEVNGRLNAVVLPVYEQARRDATAADQAREKGEPLGPLHGVPMTIKECFHVQGMPSTMGLSRLRDIEFGHDGALVSRLRRAGAVILGKTNVPQLMIMHETDNPLYGRTNNPWDVARGPGGSSGGEAAIIAARGSPLGLGSDMGGSIRVPAHFCGIHGIKPTSRRLTRLGTITGLRGMEAVVFQPGPLARRVEDLELAMKVLVSAPDEKPDFDTTPCPLGEMHQVTLEGLRVAMWADDGYFSPAPAIRRAVGEAAEALRGRGVIVEEIQPPDVGFAVGLYYALMSADGGADGRELLKGSQADSRVKYLVRMARHPRFVRPLLAKILGVLGQQKLGEMFAAAGPRSTSEFWKLCQQRDDYITRFLADVESYDAMIFPPHALPAMPHHGAINLLSAASYAFVPNLLGIPAGVVAATRVRQDEESDRGDSSGIVDRAAQKCELRSAGLPVGVQVAAGHWREDIVLALMQALEGHFETQADYPAFAPY